MSALAPLRSVVKSHIREGSSINGDFGFRQWDLTLECGHEVERPLRFPVQTGVKSHGFAAQYHPRQRSEALPPQKRARCWECLRDAAKGPTP